MQNTPSLRRLYFKSYLQMIRNAVGSSQYRNFYIEHADGTVEDAMHDGGDSCALFVSSVLMLFGRQHGIHGTVASVEKDLKASGFHEVMTDKLAAGDVIVWQPARSAAGREYEHVGFYAGEGRAVSTSEAHKIVAEHDLTYGGNRLIKQAYRYDGWEEPVASEA